MKEKFKYHIITYGCQMNKSDSERIAAVLERAGYKPAKNEKQADLIVVVACSVRQSAVDRIYGKLRQFAKLKTCNLKLKIILTGCVADKDKEKLKDKFDLILDTQEMSNLKFQNLELTRSVIMSERSESKDLKSQNLNSDSGFQIPSLESFKREMGYLKIKPRYATKFAALVPIMTGCNNFCSYCVVPYVRGREVSRDIKDILTEVKNLVKNGCLEITLLGQNVNAYKPMDVENFSKNNPYFNTEKFANKIHHGGKCPQSDYQNYGNAFAALLWEINQVPGLERVHFTAPHPHDMTSEVIEALILPKMVNYLHLPVQSGDDEVLRKMNRKYTAGDYLKLVKKIKKKKPDIALGTDIIVGFPGETKKQFENTVKLYKKVGFDIAYLAMYSPRAGTAAEKLEDDVPQVEKKRRWNVLQDLMKKITLEKNRKYVGRAVSVLVDEYKEGRCIGNSREMKRVRFLGKKNMVGKIFNVKIKKAYEWILEGEMNV